MTNFIFIRHGTTEGLETGKLQGSTDSPLSRRGRQQAEMTARFLSSRQVGACFCSPQGRAMETAAIICQPLGLEPVILEDLREYDFGWLEGHRYFQPPRKHSSIFIQLKSLARLLVAVLTGESLPHVRRRALQLWHFLLSQNLDGEIILITHGFFINIFIQEVLKDSGQPPAGIFDVDACSLTTLGIENGQPILLEVNKTSHLAEWSGNGH